MRGQVVLWNNASGGLWSDASDWNPMGVPTSSETAKITLAGKYTVTLDMPETIEGFLLDSAGASLALSSNLTLSNDSGSSAIIAGTLTLSNARILASSNSGAYAFSSAGTILSIAGTNYIYGNGGAATGMVFTNTGHISVLRSALYLGNGSSDIVSNPAGGTIAVGAGATLNLGGGSTSIDNQGTLQATAGGVINIAGPLTTADLGGSISDPGSTINIAATLGNLSQNLAAPQGGSYTLDGGTIIGGTVSSGALTFGSAGGTLSGVTMSGSFTVPSGGTFAVNSNTTFTGGTTTFSGSNLVQLSGTGTALTLAPDAAWIGNVTVAAAAVNLAMVNNGTIKSEVSSLISGAGNRGFGLTNSGFIESTGGTLSIGDGGTDTFANSAGATVEANGGNVTMGLNGATVSNLSGNTLTGGTWIASGSSAINFAGAANSIATTASSTTLELSGPGSSITSGPALQTLERTLVTNDGTLEVISNRNFASTSSGLTNNGTLQLGGGTLTAASLTNGSGSTLSGFGTLNPAGGVAIGNGVLISPGSASAHQYVNMLSFGSHGGSLGAGGAYAFDIMNSAAPMPGVDNDTISVAGALTISATPATPFSLLIESISPGTGLPGMANFSLSGTYRWTLLSAASISGFNPSDFTINTSLFANAPGTAGFFVTADSTDIFLNFTPVPEPSTCALIGTGLAAIALAASRRRGRA
jgi:fibronectin-binding autotransporter adhesin